MLPGLMELGVSGGIRIYSTQLHLLTQSTTNLLTQESWAEESKKILKEIIIKKKDESCIIVKNNESRKHTLSLRHLCRLTKSQEMVLTAFCTLICLLSLHLTKLMSGTSQNSEYHLLGHLVERLLSYISVNFSKRKMCLLFATPNRCDSQKPLIILTVKNRESKITKGDKLNNLKMWFRSFNFSLCF